MTIRRAILLVLHQQTKCSHSPKLLRPEQILVLWYRTWRKKVVNQNQRRRMHSMMIRQSLHLLNSWVERALMELILQNWLLKRRKKQSLRRRNKSSQNWARMTLRQLLLVLLSHKKLRQKQLNSKDQPLRKRRKMQSHKLRNLLQRKQVWSKRRKQFKQKLIQLLPQRKA